MLLSESAVWSFDCARVLLYSDEQLNVGAELNNLTTQLLTTVTITQTKMYVLLYKRRGYISREEQVMLWRRLRYSVGCGVS